MKISQSCKIANEAISLIKAISKGIVESEDQNAIAIFLASLKVMVDDMFNLVFPEESRENAIKLVREQMKNEGGEIT